MNDDARVVASFKDDADAWAALWPKADKGKRE